MEKESRCHDERLTKLARYDELLLQEKEYDITLLAGKASDPKEVNRVLAASNYNMEQANRWTDNTWTVKKYLTSKKGMNGKEVSDYLLLAFYLFAYRIEYIKRFCFSRQIKC
jgi:Leucine zipper with capping helix domain